MEKNFEKKSVSLKKTEKQSILNVMNNGNVNVKKRFGIINIHLDFVMEKEIVACTNPIALHLFRLSFFFLSDVDPKSVHRRKTWNTV